MTEYTFDDDGNPVPKRTTSRGFCENFAGEDDLMDIFHVQGDGYDVTLSLARKTIILKNVNPGTGRKKKGLGGLFSKNKEFKIKDNTIDLNSVIGVKLKRRRTGEQKEGEGVCLGFAVHVMEHKSRSCMRERMVLFEHPSDALCLRYVRKIEKYISEIPGRPKSVKLFLQHYAGAAHGRSLLKNKVLPLFNLADINVDHCEVQHTEFIKQEMIHINIDDYDVIIAMGGDGTVNQVADGLLTQSQKDKDIELKPGFSPTKAKVPLGIIPIGVTNHIARSVMGSSDMINAVLHIMLGNIQPVDICSVYSEDKFKQWAFNCQYGYAGNVMKSYNRLRNLGRRGLEMAIYKSMTKAKLRAYECDVEYIPADIGDRKQVPCWQGCEVCWNDEKAVDDDSGVTTDVVEEFNPLGMSGDSDTLVDLAKEPNGGGSWRTCKGQYLNVAIYVIPGREALAPRGLSKYTHLNDGVIDLVLIKTTVRKEFLRYIKRLANQKNQFELPFVEVHHAKEVRFRRRWPIGFNYKDFSFNEIDYEMSRRENLNRAFTPDSSILEIDDPIEDEPPRRFQSLQKMNTEIEDLDLEDSDDSDDSVKSKPQETERVVNGVRHVRAASASDMILVGPAYRTPFSEQERMQRQKRQQKKEEKKKAKDEKKMKSVWNIDNEVCREDELSFKVHHGLLLVCGRGVPPDTEVDEGTLLCVPSA
ncbi:hypothetical protein CHS0354_011135 [Potamilus streckersoni]|uniref:DAGKc domain-containing protein n=1 Tax=Potamilus streckersoni TaxID=2493646 RepID=A0AAE0RXX8_9BIVA|nr:hypothetical protein CHS0354_011135 [Potamilus streckersoni]